MSTLALMSPARDQTWVRELSASLDRDGIVVLPALVEAKGWRTLATRYDFQGWHADQWYDPAQVDGVPRELKMGVYLTDVKSGAFKYLRGSQGQRAPRGFRPDELGEVSPRQIMELAAPAGTAFLFDSSGVHRQSVPVLEPRQAVFFVYRDPAVPLRREEVQYQRYRPLMLNAAYLAGLSAEEQRVLGFGDKTHCVEGPGRIGEHGAFQSMTRSLFRSKLWLSHYGSRVWGKLKRLVLPARPR